MSADRKPFIQSWDDPQVQHQVRTMLEESPAYREALKAVFSLDRERMEWENSLHKQLEFPKLPELNDARDQVKSIYQRIQTIAIHDNGYDVEFLPVPSGAHRKSPAIKQPPEFPLFRDHMGSYFIKLRVLNRTKKLHLGTDDPEVAKGVVSKREFKRVVSEKIMATMTEATNAPTTRKAVEEYLYWLEVVKRASPRTVEAYEAMLKRWLRDTAVPSELLEVGHADVSRFVNGPQAKKRKRATRMLALAAVKSFFRYCINAGYCRKNPAALAGNLDLTGVPFDLKERTETKAMADDEVERILWSEHTTPFWRLATAISRWTGLRLGDVCQLEPSSFAVPGKVIVWTDKRNRRVEIPRETELEPFLAELPEPEEGYYFREESRMAISLERHRLSIDFHQLLVKLNIEGKSFRSLRVSYAQMCDARGETMPHIASKMGHAHWSTTAKYYVQNNEPAMA